MNVRVETYSGYKADERPIRFWLGDRLYLVEQILDQWYGPNETFFKVRANDSNGYILRHRYHAVFNEGEWQLEAFRREG